MAIPPNATTFTQPMDPSDTVDYQVNLSQGDTGVELLSSGEGVASYTLATTADAAALGLTIGTGGYATTLVGNVLKMWLSIASGHQGDAAFNGAGTPLALEFTITTNSSPPRIRQKTLVVNVANQ